MHIMTALCMRAFFELILIVIKLLLGTKLIHQDCYSQKFFFACRYSKAGGCGPSELRMSF